jgi:hypothetical protein
MNHRMPLKNLTALLLAAGAMFAQGPPIYAYLDLTPAQRTTIDQRVAEHTAWVASMRPQQLLASAEAAKEMAASPLNPQSLGNRYVIVLALRREVASRERDLIAVNRFLLSESQRARLQVLEEARQLEPTIETGTSLFLLPAPPCDTGFAIGRWFDTSAFQPASGTDLGAGCGGRLGAFVDQSENPFFGPAWPSLREHLALTAEQFTAMAANSRAHDQWMRERSIRVSQVQIEIYQESANEVLDALALGLRYAEIEAIRRESNERHGLLIEANQNLLTKEQRAKFEQLVQAAKLIQAVTEARGVNLMKGDCPVSRPGTVPLIGVAACGS